MNSWSIECLGHVVQLIGENIMNVNITCDRKLLFSLHVQSVLYKNDEDLKII